MGIPSPGIQPGVLGLPCPFASSSFLRTPHSMDARLTPSLSLPPLWSLMLLSVCGEPTSPSIVGRSDIPARRKKKTESAQPGQTCGIRNQLTKMKGSAWLSCSTPSTVGPKGINEGHHHFVSTSPSWCISFPKEFSVGQWVKGRVQAAEVCPGPKCQLF